MIEVLLIFIIIQLFCIWHRIRLVPMNRTGPGVLRWYWREFEDFINRMRPGTF